MWFLCSTTHLSGHQAESRAMLMDRRRGHQCTLETRNTTQHGRNYYDWKDRGFKYFSKNKKDIAEMHFDYSIPKV